MKKLITAFFVVATFLVETKTSFGQSHYLGLSLTANMGNIDFSSSSDGPSVDYSPRMTPGWGLVYGYKSNSLLIETGLSYARIESSLLMDPVYSTLSLDYLRPEATASYLFLNGGVKLKLGAGISAGYLISGEQRSLNSIVDVVEGDVYSRLDLAALGQAGLHVSPADHITFQFCYQYRYGLSNIEKDSDQTTKTLNHGFQASLLFSI